VRKAERGLSSAVLHGMNQARGEVLVVMDADLSHPAEAIPQFVEAIRSDEADFVIGSRYVASGSTEEGWGLYRWLNSKVAALLAWPLSSARDPMAGFFALRRSALASADRLDPVGYKIGLELLVKCRCRRVREIGIHFSNRVHGTSKLTFREQLNYLRHLRRLYWYRMKRAFRRGP
jgi:dolichol-phosphate mannosyltransferase